MLARTLEESKSRNGRKNEAYPAEETGPMTFEPRHGPYGCAPVAPSSGPEDRLASFRFPPGPWHREPATARESSSAAVVIFASGTAVVLMLVWFLQRERRRVPRRPEKGVGFVVARREARGLLAALAPRVVLLAERERVASGRLRTRVEERPGEPDPGSPEGPPRRVVPDGFWGSFVAVAALVEEDPEEALDELHRLSVGAETALAALDKAERTLHRPRAEQGPGGMHPIGKDENDG